ncbi:YdcF family protein [Luteimonas deserti]|uniref:YdcF family protein n=1 Tax=Luteimonas deserti TaxID=2752306 RepID=A0A7Z0QMA4_9GAMM|nr:YdcF family protein [Luteimonas deserti]NYZ61179.1 YdcF family protein [Luteimonas deserti]
MARSRLLRRLRLLVDGDALHALAVAGSACVLSLGLVYVGYVVHVWRVARTAPCAADRGDCLLVFGKHAPEGRLDPDFQARVSRAAALWALQPARRMLLLGGGPVGSPTEAMLAQRGLFALGVAADAPLLLEDRSRDTLQNLRNARLLLAEAAEPAAAPVVTLLSSRYHLARCALLARHMGLESELCAAEPALSWQPGTLLHIAREAAYVCWIDVGTRWARMIGHRRMLARLA